MHGELKLNQSRDELRKFGITVGIAFIALAALVFWRESDSVFWKVFGVVGAALLLGGLILPAQLGPVYRGWMKFALLLSKVTTPIFLGIIYFGLFLVTGLLRRAMGKNQMVAVERNGSFWAPRERGRGNLERQF